jgi:transketolase
VDWATGSLGHALSLGTGVAFGYKLQHHHRNTLVILSDGDCQEGSTWEAAMLSSKLGLDNLYCFVDANQFQATGRVEEITNLYPIAKKFESFGWKAVEVNGNNFHQVLPEIEKMKIIKGTPKALILNTVKGSGVPFMENNNNWHYKFPDDYELNLAIEQIKNAK